MASREATRPIYLVYGWPRSGTSMMMEALIAGGMDALRDDDEYFEHNHVDPDVCAGKLLKPVRTDCAAWPSHDGGYKVLFMRRDPVEQSDSWSAAFPQTLRREPHYIAERTERRLCVLRERCDCEFLELWYGDVLANPQITLREAEAFFGVHLDIDKAVAVIDPAKRRFGG